MIYTFVPYSIKGSLVEAYNQCMNLIEKDDWALFLDYDVIFTHRNWYEILDKAIKHYPEIEIFTCYTNRIRVGFQKAAGIDYENHDIKYHMKFGQEFYKRLGNSITILPKRAYFGGFMMLISKRAWEKIMPLKQKGIELVDIEISKRAYKMGIKVARLNGLYIYHWRRGNNEGPPKKIEG